MWIEFFICFFILTWLLIVVFMLEKLDKNFQELVQENEKLVQEKADLEQNVLYLTEQLSDAEQVVSEFQLKQKICDCIKDMKEV